MKFKYVIDETRSAVGCRVRGHSAATLIWWIGDNNLLQWRVLGRKRSPDCPADPDMDVRWSGRMDRNQGNVTVKPPKALYASLTAADMLSSLPVGPMTTLEHMGARLFSLDTRDGLVPLIKWQESSKGNVGETKQAGRGRS